MGAKEKPASDAGNPEASFNSSTAELIPVLKGCWQSLHDGETNVAAITAAAPAEDAELIQKLVSDALTSATDWSKAHHKFLAAADKVQKGISLDLFAGKSISSTPAKQATPDPSPELITPPLIKGQSDKENFSETGFEGPKKRDEVKVAEHLLDTGELKLFQDLTGAAHINWEGRIYNLADSSGTNALTRICKQFGQVKTFVNNVQGVLQAEALDAETIPVILRTAQYKDGIVINPSWEDGKVIFCGPDGWDITDMPTDAGFVFLHREPSIFGMPVPINLDKEQDRSALVEKLSEFLNLADGEDIALAAAIIASALLPDPPYPVVVFRGEKGTAKTTAMELVKSVVDPSPSREGISCPTDARTLFIHSRGNHLVFLDNVNTLTEDQSANISRLVQGAGHVERSLYTNLDETVFSSAAAVWMTAIDAVTTKTDLVDRSYVFNFRFIPDKNRKEKTVIKSNFAKYAPELLGMLLDGLCAVLANRPAIRDSALIKDVGLPRNADNAIALLAMAETFGSNPEIMHQALMLKTNEADRKVIEDCVWADKFIKLLWRQLDATWEGTHQELLDIITSTETQDRAAKKNAPPIITLPKDWPDTPLVFSKSINAVLPSLRKIYGAERKEINKAKRIYRFSAAPVYQSESETASDKSPDNNVVSGQIQLT